ncbi:hypothetical protein [Pelagicoccus sp. SDUM812003]|uniref:hypothetical protein n=1 Tax=Pelagicoccus sp. SDUM812003 TaxID=3041267 RepID=UPI00280CF8DB|nr:hypothetical protein [Pelagicoccus sp. SDUM812003]MDQ8203950.1 hypothetical protein [Pelagicoccus sp. SDUM812003]
MPRNALFGLVCFFVWFAVCALSLGASTDSLAQQRRDAALVLTFGELNESDAKRLKKSESYADAKKTLARSLSSKQKAGVARRNAFLDVFGQQPAESAVAENGAPAHPYVEWVRIYLEELAYDESEYRDVIERAYLYVIKRPPYEEEISYWEELGVFAFVELVGGIEDWARRNQPGLMVTGGEATISVNCPYLSSLRLSPEVAEEVARAEGFQIDAESSRTVLYPNADAFISIGPVYFLIAGGMSRDG